MPQGPERRSNPGSVVRSMVPVRRPSFALQLPANVAYPSILPTGSSPLDRSRQSWLPSDGIPMPSNSGACSCGAVLHTMIWVVVVTTSTLAASRGYVTLWPTEMLGCAP